MEENPNKDPFDDFVNGCVTAPDSSQYLPVTITVLGPTSPNHINRNIEILARESMVIDLGPLSGLNYKIKIVKCTEDEPGAKDAVPSVNAPTKYPVAVSGYEMPESSSFEDEEEDL